LPQTDIKRIRVGLLGYGLDRPATGIARYTIEIAKAISAGCQDIDLVLLQPFDGTVPGLESVETIRLRLTRLLPGLMAFGPIELAGAARKHGLDVIHDPAGVAPFIAPRQLGGCATAVTIHDMVPFVHPETHARLTNLLFHRYMPVTLRFVDRLMTVSDASKRDIMRYYKLDSSRIERVYCGVDAQFKPQTVEAIDQTMRRYQIQRPYILSVGALSARKNLQVAIEAYSVLRSRGLDHKLVLVGPKAWKNQGIYQRIEHLGLADHVLFTGYVDDGDLPAIYAGASCFVFPSLYEGFGLPPLEAMACGTPVVASNASSGPEVTGDAARLVDPQDVSGFAEAIYQILENAHVSYDLRSRGVARAQEFTWTRAAMAHATVYREIVDATELKPA
jgi:glycosyltransferase involved in cell wall biosynthesis